MDTDTIAAIATPAGRGGIGIVRVSGPASVAIAAAVLGTQPAPRRACYLPFHDPDGQVLDYGIALYFPAPHSFTGEDVLELQGHGGPVVLDLVLQCCLQHGARRARPGEFSERAFLNDKLDLAQAEAIADLIDSSTAQAARAALRSLQGRFSHQVHELVEQLTQLRMYVEAAIDFPEEEVDFLADQALQERMQALLAHSSALQAAARQGQLLRDGMHVVLAGRPNAGKSSLLNALAGHDAAIVTAVPGTTRDVVRAAIALDGMPVHVIDTAGLHDSADPVEQIGMQRAWQEIRRADRILLLVDDQLGWSAADAAIAEQLPADVPSSRIYTKIDLTGRAPGPAGADAWALSARSGAGLPALRAFLKQSMGFDANAGEFSARRRHVEALVQAHGHLTAARTQLSEARAGELAAEELRLAQQALAAITGAFTSDDLLGRIFHEFCIGK